jgi:small subunit ribosomal protein S1
MAELMAKHQGSIVALRKGDIVSGKITKLTKNEITVDLHAKGEAIVMERDPHIMRNLLSHLSVGQEVDVSVISPESESGQPVVSLRRFIDNLLWKEVEALKQSQEQVNVTISEVTRGGYVVSSALGVSGFLPNSHTSFAKEDLSVGKTIKASIADLNREDNKVIFSQKTTLPLEEYEKAVAALKVGQRVQATISNIASFGLFVTIAPFADQPEKLMDGLIHISEVSWNKVDDLTSLYKVGQTIEASVLGFDKDSRRVDLSIKRLSADPFEELKEQFPVDKKVQGTVARTEDGNIYVDLGPSTDSGQVVEGMIRKEKVPPTTTYAVGSTINATVSSLDARRRRIELVPVLLEKPLMYR